MLRMIYAERECSDGRTDHACFLSLPEFARARRRAGWSSTASNDREADAWLAREAEMPGVMSERQGQAARDDRRTEGR